MKCIRPFSGRTLAVIPAALCALLLLASCGSSGKKSVTNPNGQVGQADSLVAHANLVLENILYTQINSITPSRPSDLDYIAADNLYRQALQAEPQHAGANFGVAVLGLATLTTDTQLNAAFDAWNDYLQTHVPFQVGATPARPLGVPATLRGDLGGLRLPYEIVPLSLLANMRATRVAVDPKISLVQDVLRQRAMPKLVDAIAHLDVALAQPNFEFTITPTMQGGAGVPYRLVHHTDLLALKAGAELLHSICDVAVAYQLDFASYDSAGIEAAFHPGSGWLALVTDGASRMSDARARMLASITDAEAALAALRAQTGNHDHDLIKIPPGTRGQQEADSVQVNLERARQALNSGWRVTTDWDNDSSTPDVSLMLRVDRLFTNPIVDWKALLPAYSVAAVRVPFQTYWNYGSGTSNQSVTVPSSGYYSANQYTWVYAGPGSTPYRYFSGSPELEGPLASAVQSDSLRIVSLPGYAGSYSISASFYGNLTAGTQTIPIGLSDSYALTSSEVYAPQITWTAANAAAWTWPDPTMGGTIPDLTTNAALLSTFGFIPANWTRTILLDWTGGGAVW